MTRTVSLPLLLLIVFLTALGVPLFLSTLGCGGSSCGGTTFVNESSETVTVSADSTSGISFSTFTLEAGEEKKVCGDDVNTINATYEWPDGDTANLGLTFSGGDFCIFLSEAHTASSGNCL